MTTSLDVLLEDGPLIAVNKPAGLPTQAASTNLPSLELLLREYLRTKYEKTGNVYLGIPHRLDRPVSGVIIFSRNSKGAARLAEQFAERQVTKTYWGVVQGHLPHPKGMLCDLIRKVPNEARVEIIPDDDESELAEEAKEGKLLYRVLQHLPATDSQPARSFVEIELITGRMHQIRVQFGYRGFPVIGDRAYGDATVPQLGEGADSHERILLHARAIQLQHPVRYEPVLITAPLPDWWPAEIRELEQQIMTEPTTAD